MVLYNGAINTLTNMKKAHEIQVYLLERRSQIKEEEIESNKI